MRLYRATKIFDGVEIPDLSGKWAQKEAGTWHTTHYNENTILKPTYILYTSSNPNACELEIMANSEGVLPEWLYSQEIYGFEKNDIEILDANSLPHDWKNSPNITRSLGMQWFLSNRSLILEVPSKLYKTKNYLINPNHENVSCLQQHIEKYETDNRLR
jgi:RES domain-containing protein